MSAYRNVVKKRLVSGNLKKYAYARITKAIRCNFASIDEKTMFDQKFNSVRQMTNATSNIMVLNLLVDMYLSCSGVLQPKEVTSQTVVRRQLRMMAVIQN